MQRGIDDVVERLERQHAELGEQFAAAAVDEDDFVGHRVAVQFRLRLGGPAPPHVTSALVSSGTRPVTGSPVAGSFAGLEVVVPQGGLLAPFDPPGAGRLDLLTRVGGRRW